MAVTYAVVKQAPEVAKVDQERTIWIMKQPLSGSRVVKEARKVVVVCPFHILTHASFNTTWSRSPSRPYEYMKLIMRHYLCCSCRGRAN